MLVRISGGRRARRRVATARAGGRVPSGALPSCLSPEIANADEVLDPVPRSDADRCVAAWLWRHGLLGGRRVDVVAGESVPRASFEVSEIQVDVDISKIEDRRIRSNMGVVVVRGVWFPLGYD